VILLRCILVAVFGLVMIGCPSRSNEMRPVGPDVKADLIIYFNVTVSDAQITTFWHQVLSRPRTDGKGYDSREGVADMGRLFRAVQGHQGISVSFFPSATQAQRDELERDVKDSPLVYKVLKNIAPANVKRLE
jgi:hypothetical protein